jgi:hypothetical protein
MNAPRRNAAFRRSELAGDPGWSSASNTCTALSSPKPTARLHPRSGASRRSELARELVLAARPFLYGAALSSARPVGCALHGASLFSVAGRPAPKKISKNACPCIRVSLRSTPLIPSSLRGPAYMGHPWPITPLAASMPLAPLHEDSIRPAERGALCRLTDRAPTKRQGVFAGHCFENYQTTRTPVPVRRPSVGAAQGDARHGCRARSDETWMSLRDDPRSSAGGREVLRSKTRMLGWPSFWLLFLGHSRKSDSPSRAKLAPQPTTTIGSDQRPQSHTASRASSLRLQLAVAPTRHKKRPLVCA